MGNSVGKPWSNPEDELFRGRFDADFIPPPLPKAQDLSPLHRTRALSDDEREVVGRARALQMDCATETIEFVKAPLAIGAGFGACVAVVESKPELKRHSMRVESGLVRLSRGFTRELAYLKRPMMWTGMFYVIVLMMILIVKLILLMMLVVLMMI
jgi:hypothetical protein